MFSNLQIILRVLNFSTRISVLRLLWERIHGPDRPGHPVCRLREKDIFYCGPPCICEYLAACVFDLLFNETSRFFNSVSLHEI